MCGGPFDTRADQGHRVDKDRLPLRHSALHPEYRARFASRPGKGQAVKNVRAIKKLLGSALILTIRIRREILGASCQDLEPRPLCGDRSGPPIPPESGVPQLLSPKKRASAARQPSAVFERRLLLPHAVRRSAEGQMADSLLGIYPAPIRSGTAVGRLEKTPRTPVS
jgi:hypothetical protein